MSEGGYEIHAVCKTDIFTYFPVYLFMNSFFDDWLNAHIFEDVFDGKIEGNAILIVFDKFRIFLQQGWLLEEQFFVETDRFYILLENAYHLKILVIDELRVFKNYFSMLIFLIAALF